MIDTHKIQAILDNQLELKKNGLGYSPRAIDTLQRMLEGEKFDYKPCFPSLPPTVEEQDNV